MNVKNLVYITTIAKEGSLSEAGRKLGVSQPTLSNFLSSLETSLGVDLFLREKKQLIPTPAGRIYIDMAKQIIHVRDTTYQSIHGLTHEVSETITIGATPLRGSIMVAQIFPKFNKRFPNVKVEIKESYMQEIRSRVKNGEVTYALGSCYDSESPDFDYIIISKEEVVLGVPSFHRLAPLASPDPDNLTTVDISQLADSPFVMLSHGTTVRAISDQIFSSCGFTPTIVFETNNNLVLSNMIRRGAGVGLLPRSSMVKDAGDIVYFSLNPRYYLELCIITAKNRPLSEAARYLAYLVIQQDKDNPIYIPSMNAYAREIYHSFSREDL